METHQLYSVGLVVMLSMDNIGERSLKIISQNGIQANFIKNLSTAKSENVVKQIEWQKWRHIMQEIKNALKIYLLRVMETDSVPQALPELIKQYEALDEKYPDSKQSIESASFEQTFEECLQGPIKVITALLKNKATKDGNYREVTIRDNEAFLSERDARQPLVSSHTKVIYEDEK
jgi:hypothetical protein